MEISQSVVPSLSRVGIHLPAMSFLSSGPVWNSESLENSSWLSVEGHFSYSFLEGRWVEVLSINVVHEVGLLVEFVHVEVLDSNA